MGSTSTQNIRRQHQKKHHTQTAYNRESEKINTIHIHAMRNTVTTNQKQDARNKLIRINKKRGKQLNAQYSTPTPKETSHALHKTENRKKSMPSTFTQ